MQPVEVASVHWAPPGSTHRKRRGTGLQRSKRLANGRMAEYPRLLLWACMGAVSGIQGEACTWAQQQVQHGCCMPPPMTCSDVRSTCTTRAHALAVRQVCLTPMPEQVNTYDRFHGKAPLKRSARGSIVKIPRPLPWKHNAGCGRWRCRHRRWGNRPLSLAWLHLEADLYSHTPAAAATGQVDAAAQPWCTTTSVPGLCANLAVRISLVAHTVSLDWMSAQTGRSHRRQEIQIT